MQSDADVSVPIKKTSGCIRLQISLNERKQVTKDWSDLIEMIMMESGTTINLFGNTNTIKNRLKAEIPMNFLTNPGSKIVDEGGEIPGAGQPKKFHPVMIVNVLILNETTKKYQATFDSGDENSLKVHIRDKIVKFTANNDGIYLSKPGKDF